MGVVGDDLLELCGSAREELLLIAPFAKAPALQRIVDATPGSASVALLTRWHLDELHSGVSDLGVWDVLQGRPSSRLLLLPHLHAKYYRGDHSVLAGSANLTAKGLGWAHRSNLELLIRLSSDLPELRAFERAAIARAFPATQGLVDELRRLLEKLPPVATVPHDPEGSVLYPPESWDSTDWTPRLRHPDVLYTVYVGEPDKVTAGAWETGSLDLRYLAAPTGLDEETFHAVIGWELLQSEVVRKLDAFLTKPRRFGAVVDHLRTILAPAGSNMEAKEAWQTLMRWLLYYLPFRYEMSVARYSEIIQRRDWEDARGPTDHLS